MRRVGHLLDIIRLNGESKEVIDEIVYLAKKYGLITPYTAYLILEDEQLSGNQRPPLAPELKTASDNLSNQPQGAFKGEFEEMNSKEGKGSTTASETIRDYAGADQLNHRDVEKRNFDKNSDQTAQTLNLKDAAGRAFYQNDGLWIDSYLEKNKNSQVIKIEFNSAEYFKLAFSNKQIAEMLSLGRNVRFEFGKNIYEIIN
jgi:Ca-activated chloride channel family protein